MSFKKTSIIILAGSLAMSCAKYDALQTPLGYLLLNLPSSWPYPGWSKRRKITINNTTRSESLTNFPIHLRLNSNRIEYNLSATNGADLRFTDLSGNQLDHEIELWDTSGNSSVWLRAPLLNASSNTDFYMYYGNTTASDVQNKSGVWDSHYRGVWHLNDASGSNALDSKNGHSGVPRSDPARSSNSLTGHAMDFDGNDGFTVPHASNLQVAGDITLTAVAYLRGVPYNYIIEKGLSDNDNYALFYNQSGAVGCPGGFFYCLAYEFKDTTNVYRPQNGNTVQILQNQYYFLAVTFDDANDLVRYYINDDDSQTDAQANTPQSNYLHDVVIGYQNSAGGNFFLDGLIDEVRISATKRSSAWLNAVYTNLFSESTFASFGSAEDAF